MTTEKSLTISDLRFQIADRLQIADCLIRRARMEFLTKKHISRRTMLRGLGVTMALPVLDAMTPAATAFARTAAASKKVRLSAIEMVHGSAGATQFGLSKNMWSPAEVGHRVRPEPGRAVAARAVSRLRDDRQQHRRAQRRSVLAAGNRRRPLPLERGVPDAGASQEDAGLRRARRHVARSVVCAEASARTRRSPRCSSRSRRSTSPAAAPTVTAAPTPTASAGRRPSSRCR